MAFLTTGNIAGLLFVAYSIFHRRQAVARGVLTALAIAFLLHGVASPIYTAAFATLMGTLVMLVRVPLPLLFAILGIPQASATSWWFIWTAVATGIIVDDATSASKASMRLLAQLTILASGLIWLIG